MYYCLSTSVSVGNTTSKKSCYKWLCTLTNIILFKVSLKSIFKFYLAYSLDISFFCITLDIERMLAGEHLENHNTHGPHVNSLTVSLSGSLLWSHVKNSSHDFVDITIVIEYIRVDFSREAKVCNLGYISFLGVFWVCTIW